MTKAIMMITMMNTIKDCVINFGAVCGVFGCGH